MPIAGGKMVVSICAILRASRSTWSVRLRPLTSVYLTERAMKSTNQKEKLRVLVPLQLLVYVPVEIDREINPDEMDGEYAPVSEDHIELAKEAMIAAKSVSAIQDCVSTLGAAAIRAKTHGDGIRAVLSPFAGLAEGVEI